MTTPNEYDHDPLWLPPPTRPLSEDQSDLCPLCGSDLEHCVGFEGEEDYEGVRCPKHCNLADYYG